MIPNVHIQLREKLKHQVTVERKLLTEILENLKLVEEKLLFLEWGFGSMFDYCTRELGYSEAAAQRRIQTMHLMKNLPEVKQNIEQGKISLSVAAQVQSFIRDENKKRRDLKIEKMPIQEQKQIVNLVLNTSSRECERKLVNLSSTPMTPKEVVKPLSSDLTSIQFVADRGLARDLEKLMQLTSHKNPQGRYDLLFKELAKIALEKLDPIAKHKRQTEKSKSIAVTPTLEFSKRSRYISAQIRRDVWMKSGGQCTYKDLATDRRCQSNFQLQIEHEIPFAKGGSSKAENLTLLCSAHNRLQGFKHFGGRFKADKQI